MMYSMIYFIIIIYFILIMLHNQMIFANVSYYDKLFLSTALLDDFLKARFLWITKYVHIHTSWMLCFHGRYIHGLNV